MDKKFTNRSVDNLKLKKSKEYLWKYLSTKLDMKKKHNTEEARGLAGTDDDKSPVDNKASFGDFFRSLFGMPKFGMPKRLVSASVIAGLLLVAVIFNNSLTGWFGTKVETVYADFEMVAMVEDGSGVASDSGFILTASEDVSLDVVKEHLKVEPAVKLKIEKIGKSKYEVKPVMGLEGKKIYNFSIQTDNGNLSWAYQIQDIFKIDGTLPADQATGVPAESGIEINFSHSNYDFEHIVDYFEISPDVGGKFEKHDRIVTFVPKWGLQSQAIYTVKIKRGFKLNDSDKKLAKDFIFKFATKNNIEETSHFGFQKPYYEIAANGTVAVDVDAYNFEQMGKREVEIQVYKYTDSDKYLAAIERAMQIPNWAYYAKRAFLYPTQDLQNIGKFTALIEKANWQSFAYLPNQVFDEGYYLLEVDENGVKSQALLQITDISAYTSIAKNDSVVWVNDVKTGKPVKNATVKIGGVKNSVKTDSDGMARFTTPLVWKTNEVGDYTEEIQDVLKVKTQDGKELILAFDSSTYYPGDAGQNYWKLFITDRPQYKPTDMIQFWGFLKPRNGASKPDNLKLELMYNWDSLVQNVPVTLHDDGSFEGKLNIKNALPGSYYLRLYDGEQFLSNTGLEVEDYIKPAYNLTMESDKKAVFVGEKMQFQIKSKFFDGTPVANLKLKDNGEIDGSGRPRELRTNAKGELDVSVIAKKEPCKETSRYYCSDQDYFFYDVNSKLSEESTIEAYSQVEIFGSHLNIAASAKAQKKPDGAYVANMVVKTNWIDLTKSNSDGNTEYNNFVGEKAKGRTFSGKVTEIQWVKTESGEYYDFITKKVKKSYDYKEERRQVAKINGVTDDDGQSTQEFSIDPTKYYVVTLKADDDQGNPAHEMAYVYGEMSQSSRYDYYAMKVLNGEGGGDEVAFNQWSYPSHEFDIGETVELAIANGGVNLPKETRGSFLFLHEMDGIRDYAIKDLPYYSFTFKKENVQNMYVEGVWFDGKSYKVAYRTNLAYKKELKRLKLKVASDKEEYQPGDEVSLQVYVTDKDGKPVKSKVNFNVVDEAFYKVAYESMTDPLDEIYFNIGDGILTSYLTHINPLGDNSDPGGKGGCFTGETLIAMADGRMKAIKDIKKGDKILTKADEFSAELISAEVSGKVVKHVGEYLVINEDLEVTAEHVVFANNKWRRVADLKLGDGLVNRDGEVVKIASIRRVVKPVDVYNIEIKDYHTYFANGFFVHNEKDGGYYVRQQFKDTSIFQTVETDDNGRGAVKFKIPDNITSWRVLTRAIDQEGLQAGTEKTAIKVTLPFFADLVMNREYSVKDSPLLKVRAYGKELKEGDVVKFKPSVDNGKEGVVIEGKAFDGSFYALPKLKIGDHQVMVKADFGDLKDALKKPVMIKGSRLKQDVVKTILNVNEATVFDLGKEGATQIEFMDGGIASYYYDLLTLAYENGNRLDQVVAREAAIEILQKYFEKVVPLTENENGNYIFLSYQREGGLSLLPYSSQDLRLSALALAFDVNLDRYSKQGLRNYFMGVFKNSKSNPDDVVLAMLGLASMQEPVLLDLREILGATVLSVQQKLYIGLAFGKIGSYMEARVLLGKVAEGLSKDTSVKGVQNMALGANLAAMVGDRDMANELWKKVEVNGFNGEDVNNLYLLGYVVNSLKNAKTEPAKFSYKLGDHEEKAELAARGARVGKGESKGLVAYPGDKVTINVSKGEVTAILNFADEVKPEKFKRDERVGISRKYYVNGKETKTFDEGDIVKVVLNLSSAEKIANSGFRVTDILPSGLTPVTGYKSYARGDYYNSSINYPFMINGQEVNFSWYPYWWNVSPGTSKSVISYYAKVVGPGEYYADPARIESFYDKSIANISGATMVRIEK